MKLWMHPLARADLLEAGEHYEAHASAAVAGDFRAAFENLVELLMRQPDLGTPTRRGRRAMPLRGFPFVVAYSVRAEMLEVWVVRLQRRNPGYGIRRK